MNDFYLCVANMFWHSYSHIAKHVHYQLASIQDKPLGQGLSYGLVSSHSNKLSVNP